MTTVIFEVVVEEIQLRETKATLSAVVDRALSLMPSFGSLLMAAPLEPGDLAERGDRLRDAGL